MAYTAKRFQTVRGRTLRFTKVDACGAPVGGAASQYVTNSFAMIKLAKNMAEGNDIETYRADDTVDLYVKGRRSLRNIDVEIDFTVNDTGLLPLLSGDPAVLDYQAGVIGWEELVYTTSGTNFAVELWTGTAGTACVGNSGVNYGYWVVPFLENGMIDHDDLDNGAHQFKIMANTSATPNAWGKGPYNVVASDASNTASRLLVPMSPTAARHFEVTTIAPPTPPAAAGPQTLTLPTPY